MTSEFWMNAFLKNESLITIKRNWRCNIENISVNVNFVPTSHVILGSYNSDYCNTYAEMEISGKQVAKNTLERSILLNEKLEQFISLTKKSNFNPIVRYMGLYSGLCTHWEKSNTHNLASLEMDERKLMIELVKIGCDVRVLITLDVQKALFCGYSKEDVRKRTADLCSVCDELNDYKNFNIAVDNMPSPEPILIIGNTLVSKNYNFNGIEGEEYKGNYSYSAWSSNQDEIIALSSAFDVRYMTCIAKNRELMTFLNMDSYSQFIYYIASKKLMEEDL